MTSQQGIVTYVGVTKIWAYVKNTRKINTYSDVR
jgi:hypothetical protein